MPRRLILMTSLLAALVSPAVAQPGPPGPVSATKAPQLDADSRRDIVAQLGTALRDRYIFPDVGEQAANRIAASLVAGDYDTLTDPAAFAARLSADLTAIAHDKHMHVVSMSAPPARPPSAKAAMGPMPQGEAGVVRADRLGGGIGYIEVVGFPAPETFKAPLDRAMAGLKGSRALIIDIRRNGGGQPSGVAYLVSYLVAPGHPVEINDIVSRVAKSKEFTRERFRSQPTPFSFSGIPIYVLTSQATFSGGEEFAYDVQSLKLGSLIGEVTGGGANPVGPVPIGHDMVAMIPFGRAESPVTGTNWEGRGVQPDMVVPASDALGVALTRLGQKPVNDIAGVSRQQVFAPRTTPQPGSEAALRRLIAFYLGGEKPSDILTPGSADQTGHLQPQALAVLAPLGALKSVNFRRPFIMGGDEYDVRFERGVVTMALMVGSDGKIAAASPPMPAPPGQ
jgi:hypothetical protein